MPCLKYIIEHGTTDELRMLRGKTIECVSLIGLSVGQEVFLNDANAVMELLLKTHTEGKFKHMASNSRLIDCSLISNVFSIFGI